MEPLAALAIATATTQYLDQSLTVAQGLYDCFKLVKNPPDLSRELRREAMLVSDVVSDLTKVLAASIRNIPSSKAGRYAGIVAEFGLTMTEITARIQMKKVETKKRSRWPFTGKENQEYLSKFERYTSTFMLALQIVQGYASNFSVLIIRQNVQDQIARNALVLQNSHQMNKSISLLKTL